MVSVKGALKRQFCKTKRVIVYFDRSGEIGALGLMDCMDEKF